MKIIMVIIICFGANCQAIWEKTYYPSIEECITQSTPVRNYMIEVYPDSAGEIYCMTEPEFNKYYQYLEEGGKPLIEPNPGAS